MYNFKTISEIFSQHQPILIKESTTSAAVLIILLVDKNEKLELVITKRAESLATYAGHYSFPGGMRETEDKDLYATAIREVFEELHITSRDYSFLGELDDFEDRTGNLVRPFVVTMQKNNFIKQCQLSTDEISELYFFPLENLKQIKDEPRLHAITHRTPSYAYQDDKVFIWGLTASILVHLWNVISGEKHPLGKKPVHINK